MADRSMKYDGEEVSTGLWDFGECQRCHERPVSEENYKAQRNLCTRCHW